MQRLRRWAPVAAITQEWGRFDRQRMESQTIRGVEYQRGTLQGWEVREYRLHRHGHTCAYRQGQAGDPVLEIEPAQPRSQGGSNRVSNRVIACRTCNAAKANRTARAWADALGQSKVDRARATAARAIDAGKRPSLRDASAVNRTRWALFQAVKATGLPVATGTSGHTKWNRQRLGVPKGHALDAACVGTVEAITNGSVPVLAIKASGRGHDQRTRLTRHGFPRGYLTRQKPIRGFQTGDPIRAEVPSGQKAGTYTGRIAVRASGRFNIQTPQGVVQGINHRHWALVQRGDGYGYRVQPKIATKTEEARTKAA